MQRKFLVTGGTGFIGRALVRRLLEAEGEVRVLDNDWRGSRDKLGAAESGLEVVTGDIRDREAVREATRGVDSVCHLAYINGTETFYSSPDLVLDVAIRGMFNVLDACRAEGVGELLLASSSEVYQAPDDVPTDETVPLTVGDPLNPRYSYGGGKIASELMAIHMGGKFLSRLMIFRPHNVYGPDMGGEHVIPQFALRMDRLVRQTDDGPIRFPIQGTGTETRAFVYIEDLVDGVMRILEDGEHLGIYHVGTEDEVTIAELARRVGRCLGHEVEVVPGELLPGSVPRRCPRIDRVRALGYEPRVPLDEGLKRTVEWYVDHAEDYANGKVGGS